MQQLTSVRDKSEQSLLNSDEAGLSIGDLLHTLRSRLVLIIGCAIACMLCSFIYLAVTKPTYEGTATVRIDPGRASSLGLSDLGVVGGADADGDLHTEIAVLKSDGVALRTLTSLPDPVFQDFTGISKSSAAISEGVASLTPSQQGLLNALESATVAKAIEGTSLISVSVRANNPRTAAEVTNRLVDAYIFQSFTSRDSSVTELRAWLSAQMSTLKNQVDSAQKKLAEFQEKNNIIGLTGAGSDANTVTDRLRILNQSLATAQSDRIEKEARFRAASGADPSILATLFPDPTINALQSSQVELQGRAAQLSSKFGAKYPPLVEINKQLSSLNAQLAESQNAVRSRLRQEYDASKATQDMLQREYDAQTQIAFGVNRNQAEYAVLQGDVTASRELYDLLRRKMQQASVDADISGLKTVRVDSSRIPTQPVAPKKLLILVGSAILGLFAGVVAAFMGEVTSDKLRSRGQVEREISLPVFGMLPLHAGEEGQLTMLEHASSKEAEAYRTTRASLMAMTSDHVKKLLIASTLPDQNLSIVAANLAVSLAQTGRRVLLVDTDMRSPSLHRQFHLDNSVGLSTLLLNPSSTSSLVQPVKDLSTLNVLPAGPLLTLPSERLSSNTFHTLLSQWERAFDVIVLQSAPLLLLSDGVSLAGQADSTILLARYGITHLKSLAQARLLMERAGAHIDGIIITGVPAADLGSKTYGRMGNAYFA